MEKAPNGHIAGRIRTRQSWIGRNDHSTVGLTLCRRRPLPRGSVGEWIEHFAGAAAGAAHLAKAYLRAVQELSARWRAQLAAAAAPRADAAAWAVIEILPAHPMITGTVAAAATGRSRAPIYQALPELETAGVLVPLSASKRNQSWEAVGLLAGLEAGELLLTGDAP